MVKAIEVRESAVRICTWNGEDTHHAHAIYALPAGVVVSVGDDVPRGVLGHFVAFHWYRRIGDECVIARGDGSILEEAFEIN